MHPTPDTAVAEPANEISTVEFAQFLEAVPPGQVVAIAPGNVTTRFPRDPSPRAYSVLAVPDLALYCGDGACDRIQFFTCSTEEVTIRDWFLTFTCRNCGSTTTTAKTFAFRLAYMASDAKNVKAVKFGEIPAFGPPLSSKLLQLAGANGAMLKKGRRCENQSLGIGAFAYYRRVVEDQKNKLIDEIAKAVERLGADPRTLEKIQQAKTETQFTTALEHVAALLPTELYVKGQNPLKLLHGPLSVGLHGLSDAECLNKAHSVRIVLAALLERVQQVTAEEGELDAAIQDLLKP